MHTRDLQLLIRLIATLLFGLSVLVLLALLSAQMASHYLQGVAERSVRQVFTEGGQSEEQVGYDTACRESDSGPERFSVCDPILLKGERSFRSASCSGRGLLGLLGKRWTCIAKFADGSILRLHVSLGLRRRHVELVLPFREPGT